MLKLTMEQLNNGGMWTERLQKEELFQQLKQRTGFLTAVTDGILEDSEITEFDKATDMTC